MYQPKISDENIRLLYQLRVKAQKPMTHVLDEILKEYFSLHPIISEKKPQKKLQEIQLCSLASN